jgi:MFS family permease
MTGESREHEAGKLLLIACAIGFGCFFGSYMRIPVVPLFATSLGADSVQVGMINGAFMLMAGALSIPSGLVSDRWGRRFPLLGGLILLALSSFLLYWSRTPLQMAGIYLLFGVGLSAFSPTLMSYVADVTPPEVLGQAYGWYTMAVYGGMTVGPAAGGFLGKALGLRQVFLVAGGLIFAMFLVALVFLPAPPAGSHGPAARPAVLPALKGLARNRRFIACLVATLGSCSGFGMFVTFMPLYIRSLGMHSAHVGFVFAAQALANALSRLPSGRLSDRLADRRILVTGGLAVFAVALAAFGLCRTVAQLMAIAALMGVSMGIAFTSVGALIADVVPRELRGLAMGCYNTCVYSGMMLSAAGMGGVIEGAGFRTAFFLNGAAGGTVVLLFAALYRRQAEGRKGCES